MSISQARSLPRMLGDRPMRPQQRDGTHAKESVRKWGEGEEGGEGKKKLEVEEILRFMYPRAGSKILDDR